MSISKTNSLVGGTTGVNIAPIGSGVIDPVVPTFTDNGDGTATIGEANVGLYSTPDFQGPVVPHYVPSATLSFTDGLQQFIVVEYNGGFPRWVVEDNPDLISGSDRSMVFTVWRQGSILHSTDQDSVGVGLASKINTRILRTSPYMVDNSGALLLIELNTPAPRTIKITGAYVFKGVAKEYVQDMVSDVDLMTRATRTSGGWVYTDVTQYDATFYNPNGSGDVTLPNNKWKYLLHYRSIGDIRQSFYVNSPEYFNSIAEARTASSLGRNDLPSLVTGHCLLVGRSLFQQGAVNGVTEPFQPGFGFSAAIPHHNDTLEIQGGSMVQRFHLTETQHFALTSRTLPVIQTAVSYQVLPTDQIIQATAMGITLTLPTAIGLAGRTFTLENASPGNITVAAQPGQTVNLTQSSTLGRRSSITVFSDGTKWGLM